MQVVGEPTRRRRVLDEGERTGGREHVLESAGRDAGHVLSRPPRGCVGDQELAGARVEVVDEQRGFPGFGDRLRGPGPDADHVDEISGNLPLLVLRQQPPRRIGAVHRDRQELDFGAAADELCRQLPLPGLVVVTDVGPGRLARWDVAEDQPHPRPGFGLRPACPEPGALQEPAAQPLTSAQPAQRPRNPRRCTPQSPSWTMLRRPSRDIVDPPPPSTHMPRPLPRRIATDPTVASSRSRSVCGSETRWDPLVPCPARGQRPWARPAKIAIRGSCPIRREEDGSRRDVRHESRGS